MPVMKKKLKAIPAFKAEAEERAFWETHDSSDYVDWNKAIVAVGKFSAMVRL